MAIDPGNTITWGVLPQDCLDRVVVCSPHFDDAALGAAHLLIAHPGSTVVTVFGGRPARYPDPPTEWDALGGFRAGHDVVGLRREEDRAAPVGDTQLHQADLRGADLRGSDLAGWNLDLTGARYDTQVRLAT